MGLLGRLFALIGVAILPAIAIQGYNEFDLRRSRAQEVGAQALRLAILDGAQESRILEGAKQLLIAVTKLPSVRELEGPRCSLDLAGIIGDLPSYAFLGAVDSTGMRFCGTPLPYAERISLSDHQFFIHARDSRDFAIGAGEALGKHSVGILEFGYPFFRGDGEFAGVVYGGLNLNWLQDQIVVSPLPADAVLSIADRNGVIIARFPGSRWIGAKLPPAQLALLDRARPGTAELEGIDGVSRIYGYLPLGMPNSEGLFLSVGIERNAVFRAIDRATWRGIALILAGIFAAALTAWLFGRRVVLRPVAALLAVADAWRKGAWSVRAPPSGGRTEFGRLTRAFNEMAEAHEAREAALHRALAEAESANRTKSRFLANMSHELRTPLNAIIGFSDVMVNRLFGPLGADQYEQYARHIHDSGRHLLGMITYVLDLSKVEAGAMELKLEEVAVRPVIDEALAMLGQSAAEKRIAIGASYAPDLPPIRADKLRLRQILINIVSNSIKYSAANSEVAVGVGIAEGRMLEITVVDNGIGMRPEDIPKALLPFGRVGDTASHEGIGLGLPITKSLVELHGGRLAIESAIGAGTRVAILLPLADPPVLAKPDGARQSQGASRAA